MMQDEGMFWSTTLSLLAMYTARHAHPVCYIHCRQLSKSCAATYSLVCVSCSLAKITKLEVKAGISCLSLAREHSQLFVGLNNGKMLITPAKKKKVVQTRCRHMHDVMHACNSSMIL